MSELVVRAYNVLFGDALLVSVPERDSDGQEVTRHLLIDVGNLLFLPDDVFEPVANDIRAHTGGTVDLYVMTHEHMDHVKGLYAAHRAGITIEARHAWLTGSAAPDYYDHHPDAARQRSRLADALRAVSRLAVAQADPWHRLMIENNSMLLDAATRPASTAACIDHLRHIAPADATHYIDRETDLAGLHPFTEARLRVLAPEADTSAYYGRIPPPLTSAPAEVGAFPQPPRSRAATRPQPPVGIDAGAFFDLVESRERGTRTVLHEIDKAANNTSIVLEVEWRGWRLLFGGDAEERSWRTVLRNGPVKPVHVLKVSHHGSVNGTTPELFDAALPPRPDDDRPRYALLSTHDGDWPTVPDSGTLDAYRERVTLVDTRSVPQGEPVTVTLPG